jgi:hypothetical protein
MEGEPRPDWQSAAGTVVFYGGGLTMYEGPGSPPALRFVVTARGLRKKSCVPRVARPLPLHAKLRLRYASASAELSIVTGEPGTRAHMRFRLS